jgi:hypothetical protein
MTGTSGSTTGIYCSNLFSRGRAAQKTNMKYVSKKVEILDWAICQTLQLCDGDPCV